jgi:hypothetical protein
MTAAAPTEQPAADTATESFPAEAAESDDDVKEELPAVEELVKRLRPEALAALEELFRAKWTNVKRLRPEDLKSGQSDRAQTG